MTKVIHIWFNDEEHKLLSKVKGKMSWHDFIMLMKDYEFNEEHGNNNNNEVE